MTFIFENPQFHMWFVLLLTGMAAVSFARERVPIVGTGPGLRPASLGVRTTFADIGETVAEHLGIPPGPHGTSFLSTLRGDA